MRSILVLNGDLKGKRFPVDEKVITLGRDAEAVIRIQDTGVSRHHAEIYRTSDLVFLKDLGSTNGCFINDEKVSENVLSDGDRVQIGTTVLLYTDKQEALGDLEKQVDYETTDNEIEGAKTIEIKLDRGTIAALTGETAGEEVQAKNLALVYDVAKLIGSQKDLAAVLREVLHLAVKTTMADSGFIFLLDSRTGKLDPKAVLDQEGGSPGSKISRSVVKRVMSSNSSILSSDAGADSRFKGSESVVIRKIKSVICAPLTFQEKVNGVLYLHSSSMLTSFEQPELEAATAIAIQLGSAIAGHLANLRVRKLVSSTIRVLVTAMEMREPKTAGHSERVAAYAAHMARQLKMSPGDVRKVYLAGLLHDVGKIALPPAEKFTGGHKVRSDHPLVGAKILANLEGLQDILPAVKYHHELWDGSGYPEGLKGDKIPAIARLIAVANAFDNLCTASGGEGGAVAQVLIDLGHSGGKEYDDKIVHALLLCNEKGKLFQPVNLLDEL